MVGSIYVCLNHLTCKTLLFFLCAYLFKSVTEEVSEGSIPNPIIPINPMLFIA